MWLFTPEYPGKRDPRSQELFLKTIMPDIESKLGNTIKHRYLMGISMGGFNVAQLIFRNPELFEKGVMISPLIYSFTAFTEKTVIDKFIIQEDSKFPGRKHKILRDIFGWNHLKHTVYKHLEKMTYYHYPDQKAWEAGDIINNIKIPQNDKFPQIYVSCGKRDENGLYPGSEILAARAAKLGYPVKWRSLDGGHSVKDEKEISKFIIE